jgi:hypothetical protein
MVMRLLREPLFHFFLLGGAIFAAHAWLQRGAAPPPDAIVVTRGRIEALAANFAATHGRPPGPEERDALVEAYVREEIFVREATSLGLDKEDPVIRDRLRQKMLFLEARPDPGVMPDEALYRRLRARYDVIIEGSR